MRRLFEEATKIVEEDVRRFHDAAQHFEEVAHMLPKSQKFLSRRKRYAQN
jgi:hypothetical protein